MATSQAVTAPYPAELEAAIGKTQWAIHQAGQRTLDARNRAVIQQRNVLLGILGAMLVALIGVSAANMRMSGQSRLIPYVITTTADGKILDAKVLAPKSIGEAFASEQIIRNEVANWVEDWRYVTTDRIAIWNIGTKVFAMVDKHSGAQQWLKDWYRANDPESRSRTERVSGRVLSAIPQSLNTWEIYWEETQADLSGQSSRTSRWRTVVTIALRPPTPNDDPNLLRLNPYGVYVTSVQPPQPEPAK